MAADCGSRCPVDGGFYSYEPSIAGNAVLLAAFALLLPAALFTGARYRTPLFSATLTTALLLEVLGFIGRVLLHNHRDSQKYFTLSLLGTLLGPAFMSLALFLVLPHTLSVYGENLSPLRPMFAGFLLYSLITLAIILQVIGLVFASHGVSSVSAMESVDIVAGGLGLQIVSLIGFLGLHVYMTLGPSGTVHADPKHAAVYRAPRFTSFLRAMEAATFLLLAYSVYRIVEMTGGVNSVLFQNQAGFMVICGAIPLIICVILIVFSPGAAFGSAWRSTSPRRPKRRAPPLIQHQHPMPGYNLHHRYDPNIRKSISPTTQKPRRQSNKGDSPGLPPNPRPTYKPASPLTSRSSPKTSPRSPPVSAADSIYSDRPFDRSFPERQAERRSHTRKEIVQPDALW